MLVHVDLMLLVSVSATTQNRRHSPGHVANKLFDQDLESRHHSDCLVNSGHLNKKFLGPRPNPFHDHVSFSECEYHTWSDEPFEQGK